MNWKASVLAAALLAMGAFVPAQTALAQGPQPIEQVGTYFHRDTDTAFPERVGDYQRTTVYRYDAEAKDVSVSYQRIGPEGRLVLTMYVYPSRAVPGPRESFCRQLFQMTGQVIAMQHSGATRLETGAAPAASGAEPSLSHKSAYAFRTMFDGEERDVRSELYLYCFVGGDWLVKYRMTAPTSVDSADAVAEFIRSGPWPGRRMPDSTAVAAANAAVRGR
jgi:hypothetical protein